MTTIHDLYARRDALRRVADDAAADVEMAEAEIAIAEGEPLRAEWNRLNAEALRSPRYAEGREKAHKAWVIYMADMHVRQGTVPHDNCAEEIEQAMDEMRDAALTAPRPSHETAEPTF